MQNALTPRSRSAATPSWPTGLVALLLIGHPAPLPATPDLIFADGFESGTTAAWSSTEPTIWHPVPGTSWQWQLDGEPIDTSFDVDMYDVDLFDTLQATIDLLHTDRRIVVCYFSAGSWEAYRPDAASFPESVKGDPLDPPFADELWLDIRDPTVRGLMLARLDLAVSKRCDGVEPDNVDGYTNSPGFALTAADQLDFNRFIAAAAHERSLSVGLKNDLEQIGALMADFDWALNEQCFEFSECDLLDPFIAAGKAVFGVEYSLDPATFCPQANARGFSWLKKNIALDAYRVDCLASP